MKLKKEHVVVTLFIVFWFAFWTYMGNETSNDSSVLKPQTNKSESNPAAIQAKKCQEIKAQGEKIDKDNSELVNQARDLQRIWIIKEMTKLRDSQKISTSEWEVFSKYIDVGDGTPKLPLGDIETLMNRVVNAGYIKPYLPKEVVDLGTKAALSPSSSDFLVNYPECFDEIEFGLIKSLAGLAPNKGAWGNRVENPVFLIP